MEIQNESIPLCLSTLTLKHGFQVHIAVTPVDGVSAQHDSFYPD